MLCRQQGILGWRISRLAMKPDGPLLLEVNLEALPGELVALVGHTGSGEDYASVFNPALF